MSETCSACGAVMETGSWPFCPHGKGSLAAHPDDVPGGFVVENGFDQPTRFYSHSEHRAALEARGLEIVAKYCGPADKHMSNWAAGIDAGTLENAKVLVSRSKNTPFASAKELEEFPIEVTNIRFERPD